MAIREKEIVLADGTFHLAITSDKQVLATIRATTALGPLALRVAVETPAMSRALAQASQFRAARTYGYGRRLHGEEAAGIFDDIGKAVSKAAQGAFNGASKALTTAARPVFNVAKTAAAVATNTVAKALPSGARQQLEAASRIMTRARLGDVDAKTFLRGVSSAAKNGVQLARSIGGTLLDANRLVSRAMSSPVALLEQVPGIGGAVSALNPARAYDQMLGAIRNGDWNKLQDIARTQISNIQSVSSIVPGVGTGISTALGTGMALLEGGKPLEIAVRAAYSAIPIPPGVRSITDSVLAAVLSLALRGEGLTDAAVVAARERVPSGFPRDVFDTLVRLVVKKQPLKKASTELLNHYVNKYGGPVAAQTTRLLAPAGRLIQPARVGEEWTEGDWPNALEIVGMDDFLTGAGDVLSEEMGAAPTLADDIEILKQAARRRAA